MRSGGAERTAPPPHCSTRRVAASLSLTTCVQHVITYQGTSVTKPYLNQSPVSLFTGYSTVLTSKSPASLNLKERNIISQIYINYNPDHVLYVKS